MIMSSAIQIFSPELHSVQDFGKMKKIKLFSNFTAHSGVITLKDGLGFSFQLEPDWSILKKNPSIRSIQSN